MVVTTIFIGDLSKNLIYLSFILAFSFGYRLNNCLLIYNDDIKKFLNFLPIHQWMITKNIKEFTLKHLIVYIVDVFLVIIWIIFGMIGLFGSFSNQSIKKLKQKIDF